MGELIWYNAVRARLASWLFDLALWLHPAKFNDADRAAMLAGAAAQEEPASPGA